MDPDQELFVTLQRVADRLLQDTQMALKPSGLSPQQYNVLRILRGAKSRLSCTEIASRMINRDPDMTRLLDRIEAKGWIERSRDGEDRRVVLASITKAGLALLAELDAPVQESHRRQFEILDGAAKRTVIEALKLLLP
jgi:DNA-binding MarR family transcriptional regulator